MLRSRTALLASLLETEPELILPVFTIHGGPVLALGREYLADVLRRFQADGVIPEFDPVPMAEVMARLALSLALTPESALPLDDPAASRAVFRAHIVPALGLPAGPYPPNPPNPPTRRSN